MKDLILIINSGSSSIKFAIMHPESGEVFLTGLAEALGLPEARIKWKIDGNKGESQLEPGADHKQALIFLVENILSQKPELLSALVAIGHRVVNGGSNEHSCVIDDSVIKAISDAAEVCPLHNPAALLGISVTTELFPALAKKQVAVFDTSFHTTMPAEAYTYAVPKYWREELGIRKYGYHGTSHRYITSTLAKMIGKREDEVNLINCHLGNGSSVCAVRGGKSVDTSMGFSPAAGLVMGTRCGDIDPSLAKHICRKLNITVDEFDRILNKECGLLGLTNASSDCRYVEENFDSKPECKLAMEVYAHRVAHYIGGYIGTLDVDYLDAIVFTGGIGENASLMRKLIVDKLRLLGYRIDNDKNNVTKLGKEGIISVDGTPVIMVIPTNEELVIAQDAYNLTRD